MEKTKLKKYEKPIKVIIHRNEATANKNHQKLIFYEVMCKQGNLNFDHNEESTKITKTKFK